MFKAKKEGYVHITLFFSLICGDHGYIFSGNSGMICFPVWSAWTVFLASAGHGASPGSGIDNFFPVL